MYQLSSTFLSTAFKNQKTFQNFLLLILALQNQNNQTKLVPFIATEIRNQMEQQSPNRNPSSARIYASRHQQSSQPPNITSHQPGQASDPLPPLPAAESSNAGRRLSVYSNVWYRVIPLPTDERIPPPLNQKEVNGVSFKAVGCVKSIDHDILVTKFMNSSVFHFTRLFTVNYNFRYHSFATKSQVEDPVRAAVYDKHILDFRWCLSSAYKRYAIWTRAISQEDSHQYNFEHIPEREMAGFRAFLDDAAYYGDVRVFIVDRTRDGRWYIQLMDNPISLRIVQWINALHDLKVAFGQFYGGHGGHNQAAREAANVGRFKCGYVYIIFYIPFDVANHRIYNIFT